MSMVRNKFNFDYTLALNIVTHLKHSILISCTYVHTDIFINSYQKTFILSGRNTLKMFAKKIIKSYTYIPKGTFVRNYRGGVPGCVSCCAYLLRLLSYITFFPLYRIYHLNLTTRIDLRHSIWQPVSLALELLGWQ